MINREIIYERDIYRSYMKIPSVQEANFDEKLIVRRAYAGCVPIEKCYVNGCGQYWYDITGKQALDAYCRVNTIGRHFFETLILRICNQLEQLEWNLLDSGCLMIDPELIFVNSRGEDINFTLYPMAGGNFREELQQLVEYLLTKLNHDDAEVVQTAYQIYDITLSEEYSIGDLKDIILRKRKGKEEPRPRYLEDSMEMEDGERELLYRTEEVKMDEVRKIKEGEWIRKIEEKIANLCEKAKLILTPKQEEETPVVVYPEEPILEETEAANPTICLSVAMGQPKGILVYEGLEGYTDFALNETACMIGKHPRARMCIDKDTISQFHARIDYIDQAYYIEDLNSTNGTFVDNEILNYKERRKLCGGEIIRFADVKYRFL